MIDAPNGDQTWIRFDGDADDSGRPAKTIATYHHPSQGGAHAGEWLFHRIAFGLGRFSPRGFNVTCYQVRQRFSRIEMSSKARVLRTMAARHGTRRRYNEGCHCGDCTAANNAYQAEYRQRRVNPVLAPVPSGNLPEGTPPLSDPGPVESGVLGEIDGLASEARPGLAQVALALARVLDDPKAINQKPAAAKVLAALLDKLRSASARGRRGGLGLVRTMTEKGGAPAQANVTLTGGPNQIGYTRGV